MITALLLVFSAKAQYDVDFVRTFGGHRWDEAKSIIETKDGNLVLAGYTKKGREKYLWIIKLDEQGRSRWGKTYESELVSSAESIIETTDGNIVAAGYTYPDNKLNKDLWILKLDSTGKELWSKTYGGQGDEAAHCVIQTSDGGYALAGFSSTNADFSPDFWMLKLDENGNKEWDFSDGGSRDDFAFSIIETADKGFAAAGLTRSKGQSHMSGWVVKLDAGGNWAWDHIFNQNKWDAATSIVETEEKFLVVSGYMRFLDKVDYEALAYSLTPDGQLRWHKTYGWGDWEEATGSVLTYDNSIAISAFSRTQHDQKSDFWVLKIDVDGTIIWNRIFNTQSLDYANDIVETIDNGLILVGCTYNIEGDNNWDFAMMKFKNLAEPSIRFFSPLDSVSTFVNPKYRITACINVVGRPYDLEVLLNGKQIANQGFSNGMAVKRDVNCNYFFDTTLGLQKGKNQIEIKVTDVKGYSFSGYRTVYYVPQLNIDW